MQNLPEGVRYDDEDFDTMEEHVHDMDGEADEVDDEVALPPVQRPRRTSSYVLSNFATHRHGMR